MGVRLERRVPDDLRGRQGLVDGVPLALAQQPLVVTQVADLDDGDLTEPLKNEYKFVKI